jgi:uncharacterized membrane protein YeaQ/YmgE (transglycosylase-associated protein family)
MATFAVIPFDAGRVVVWVIVALVVRTFAGDVGKGGAFGALGALIAGLAGALAGGFLFGLFVSGTAGFWGSIVAACLGAWGFIAALRAASPAPERP